MGALDATAMELDRIANQTPGNPSFWEVIKAVEFWERQHAALLNQGDPSSTIRRSTALGATVLFGDPSAIGKRPTPCTWCSQKGHEETTCVREPRCIKCFGPHPERYHDAVALEEARRASSLLRCQTGRRTRARATPTLSTAGGATRRGTRRDRADSRGHHHHHHLHPEPLLVRHKVQLPEEEEREGDRWGPHPTPRALMETGEGSASRAGRRAI